MVSHSLNNLIITQLSNFTTLTNWSRLKPVFYPLKNKLHLHDPSLHIIRTGLLLPLSIGNLVICKLVKVPCYKRYFFIFSLQTQSRHYHLPNSQNQFYMFPDSSSKHPVLQRFVFLYLLLYLIAEYPDFSHRSE